MGDIRARLTSFSLSIPLLAVVGFAVGCGDNAPAKTGTGGSGNTGTGGVAGSPGTGGIGGAGGAGVDGGTGGTGGSEIDGGTGGAGTGGVGGAGTGGVGGSGGAGTGGVGGAGTGGAGGSGGVHTGGTGGGTGGVGGGTGGIGGAGTGGVGTGGSGGGTGGVGTGGIGVGTGGVGTGGVGTGGVGTGGVGTGGVGTGGVGTGGVGGGTGGVGGATGGTGGTTVGCYTTAFTAPSAGATLTVADDSDHTCANGFQYTVTITSNAPDGTDVTLYDGSSLLKTVQVSGGTASFPVQLATSGTAQQLSIQYPSTAACNVTEMVTVSCPNSPPTCTISKPVITATHPDLNGVAAPQGDRTSSAGSPYQATLVVNTSAEDGQTVTLAVDNVLAASTPVDGTPSAVVSGGSATFGLTLAPDGTYEVVATCLNLNGITGTSTKSSFTVDTTPPVLTIDSPTAGQFLGPLASGRFNVCAETTSTDAAALPSSLGPGQSNLCVTLGSAATPSCVAVAAVNASSCVAVTCPGGAPFSLTVTLNDAAGNPTTQTITGVSCASTLPSVQIVAPASDAPLFNDPTKHILAANAPTGVKDQDPATAGAQADVVACTDTAGTATLFAGHKGDASLAQLGGSVTTVAAVAGDNCPTGLGFVAHFTGVTLPESNEDATGALVAATELTVSVTSTLNSADTGSSGADDVWVDSVAPSLVFASPGGLCGSFTQSSTTVREDVSYTADDNLVVADVTNNGVTTTYDTPAYVGGVATFGSVAFAEGQNALVATESDPAGNATILPTCTVTIGTAPVVQFTTPIPGALLCPNGASATGCIDDNATGTPGWQGSLVVNVTAGAGQPVVGSVVTFTDGATVLGAATTDAAGNAQINAVTIPEGVQTLTATTDSVPGAGVGSGSATVTVDTVAPNAPTTLSASIPNDDVKNRRKVLVGLVWTAPSDGGGTNPVAGYQVRYAKAPITAANFDDATVTTAFAYVGTPASPGQVDGIRISPLYMEMGYYFAVKAVDVAGSLSPPVATTTALTSHFNTTTLTGVGTDGIGIDLDGSGDFGTATGLGFAADGISDLIVGGLGGTHAYVYFGTATGYSTTPSITFTGAATNFGAAVVNAGDLDGDGLPDIAIASPNEGGGKIYVFSRKNPPASWGTVNSWPATLTDAQANYVITVDPTYAGGSGSIQSRSLARIGNFDGLGSDDLAIGLPLHGSYVGGLLIAQGGTSFGSATIPGAAAYEIDGTVASGFFGYNTIGIGKYFSSNGPALVTAAIGGSAIYAYGGQSPASPLTAGNATDSVVGPPADFYGYLLGYLGPVGGSPGAISVSSPYGTPGYVDLYLGTASTGPLLGPTGGAPAPSVRFEDSQAGNSFGSINFGTGIRGTLLSASLIGDDSLPDLVVSAQVEIGTPIYIVNGAALSSLTGIVDVAAAQSQSGATPAVVKVSGELPSGWVGNGGASLVLDSNGDGVPDFAIGEYASGKPGRVVVFY